MTHFLLFIAPATPNISVFIIVSIRWVKFTPARVDTQPVAVIFREGPAGGPPFTRQKPAGARGIALTAAGWLSGGSGLVEAEGTAHTSQPTYSSSQ